MAVADAGRVPRGPRLHESKTVYSSVQAVVEEGTIFATVVIV